MVARDTVNVEEIGSSPAPSTILIQELEKTGRKWRLADTKTPNVLIFQYLDTELPDIPNVAVSFSVEDFTEDHIRTRCKEAIRLMEESVRKAKVAQW